MWMEAMCVFPQAHMRLTWRLPPSLRRCLRTPRPRSSLGTGVHHHMSVHQSLSLEAGRQEQLGIPSRHVAESPGGLHCRSWNLKNFCRPSSHW